MSAEEDTNDTGWGFQSQHDNRNASAVDGAAAVCHKFDSKSRLRDVSRENSVPVFDPEELTLSNEFRCSQLCVELKLKRIQMLESPQFAADHSMQQHRQRFASRCSTDGHFSVKFLRQDILDSDVNASDAAAELMAEAKILSNLAAHPNITKLYGWAAAGPQAFAQDAENGFFVIVDAMASTVQERMDTWSAGSTSQSMSVLTERLEIALDIASALQFLDSRGIVYYLRPDKVGFDSKYERVKLCDFSQAREQGDPVLPVSLIKSVDSEILGYTAPEVHRLEPANTTSDVYAFGILLWQILALKPPFQGMHKAFIVKHVIGGTTRPNLHSSWGNNLTKLISDCWHPNNRPPMKEVFDSLETMLLFDDFNEPEQQQQQDESQLLKSILKTQTAPSSSDSECSPTTAPTVSSYEDHSSEQPPPQLEDEVPQSPSLRDKLENDRPTEKSDCGSTNDFSTVEFSAAEFQPAKSSPADHGAELLPKRACQSERRHRTTQVEKSVRKERRIGRECKSERKTRTTTTTPCRGGEGMPPHKEASDKRGSFRAKASARPASFQIHSDFLVPDIPEEAGETADSDELNSFGKNRSNGGEKPTTDSPDKRKSFKAKASARPASFQIHSDFQGVPRPAERRSSKRRETEQVGVPPSEEVGCEKRRRAPRRHRSSCEGKHNTPDSPDKRNAFQTKVTKNRAASFQIHSDFLVQEPTEKDDPFDAFPETMASDEQPSPFEVVSDQDDMIQHLTRASSEGTHTDSSDKRGSFQAKAAARPFPANADLFSPGTPVVEEPTSNAEKREAFMKKKKALAEKRGPLPRMASMQHQAFQSPVSNRRASLQDHIPNRRSSFQSMPLHEEFPAAHDQPLNNPNSPDRRGRFKVQASQKKMVSFDCGPVDTDGNSDRRKRFHRIASERPVSFQHDERKSFSVRGQRSSSRAENIHITAPKHSNLDKGGKVASADFFMPLNDETDVTHDDRLEKTETVRHASGGRRDPKCHKRSARERKGPPKRTNAESENNEKEPSGKNRGMPDRRSLLKSPLAAARSMRCLEGGKW